MNNSHYFSANPKSDYKESLIEYTIKGKRFKSFTSSGVFSYKHFDLGTRVLLEYIIDNAEINGKSVLDLGSGWGAVSQVLSAFFPDSQFYYTDLNKRALHLSNKNLENQKNCYQWDEEKKLDFCIANPPIKSGKKALEEFTNLALDSLKESGEIYYVMHKNLGADSFIKNFDSVYPLHFAERLASKKGYRIIKIIKN
ncbi:MAG: methyltransferase [Bifidobacteriaceae bacterium]|jgi:16S rRNA (guanine1207-N2)-methyltransferase|nr:methyltransferase [Bifidobacteriaceae bacterium]